MVRLLTAEELAERLRVRPNTVKAWARDGRIPAIRLSPKIIRFDLDEVVEALRRRTAERQGEVADRVD